MLTPKQEAFCLAYIETGNASEAYRRAYKPKAMTDKSVNEKASQMLAMVKIRSRVSELQAPVVEKAQITLESHLKRLADLSEAAEGEGQFSAAITAEIARGKASGVAVEKTETKHTGGIDVRVSLVAPKH